MKKVLLGLLALSAVTMAAEVENSSEQNSSQFNTNGMYLNFRLGLDRGAHYISDGNDYKHDASEKADDFGEK